MNAIATGRVEGGLLDFLHELFNDESKSVLGTEYEHWATGLQRAVTLIESLRGVGEERIVWRNGEPVLTVVVGKHICGVGLEGFRNATLTLKKLIEQDRHPQVILLAARSLLVAEAGGGEWKAIWNWIRMRLRVGTRRALLQMRGGPKRAWW